MARRSAPFRLMEHDEVKASLRTMGGDPYPGGLLPAERDLALRDFKEVLSSMGARHLLAMGAGGDQDLARAQLASHREDGAVWLLWSERTERPRGPAPEYFGVKGTGQVRYSHRLFAVPCTKEGVEFITATEFPAKLERARRAKRSAKANVWNALELDEQALLIQLARVPAKERSRLTEFVRAHVEIRSALEPLSVMPDEVADLIDETRAPDPATLQDIVARKKELLALREQIRAREQERQRWASESARQEQS